MVACFTGVLVTRCSQIQKLTCRIKAYLALHKLFTTLASTFSFNSKAKMPINLKHGAYLCVLTFGLLSHAATLQSRSDKNISACVSNQFPRLV